MTRHYGLAAQMRSVPDRGAGRRLDLTAIAAALLDLERAFPDINDRLNERHDPLEDSVVDRMVAGYAYVDRLVADGVDLFAMGNLRHLCEINFLVLLGDDPNRRAEHVRLTKATEEHFYDQEPAGIRDVVAWWESHRGEGPWRLAAGLYIRMVSAPQLFLEGNHRTGVLAANYILARAGAPPFVLTSGNADRFFAIVAPIAALEKRSLAMRLRMPGLRRRFATFLEAECDPSFFRPNS